MKELKITLVFIILAAAAAVSCWYVNRSIKKTENVLGTQIFPDFKDLNDAASLEIVKYNSESSEKSSILIKQVDNRWSIESHDNYPTDAQSQLADVVKSVMGLEILSQVSSNVGDQETYGVVDPDKNDLPPGSPGVGTKVVLRNAHDDVLLGLVIGNHVKDKYDLRYVRCIGQNTIYTTTINTDKLSTSFGDWIEKNLLQINAWDIKSITVNDLSLKFQNNEPFLRDNGMMKFAFDDHADPSWSLDKMMLPEKNGKKKSVKLSNDYVLNHARIGEVAKALEELTIVDVRRKSDAFSKSLKQTGSIKVDVDTQKDLISKGFCLLPIPGPDGKERVTLLSTDGDIIVDMGGGVEYVLRFGAIADNVRSHQNESSANRYLFVIVQFNPDGIEKPRPALVPESPNENSSDAASVAEINKKIADVKAANEKKLKQYEAAVAKAMQRVEKLNKRFADWYYIIDESEYKKIRVTRAEAIVKRSELNDHECDSECDHDHDHGHASGDEAGESAPEAQEQPVDTPSNPPELDLDEYKSPELEDLSEIIPEEPQTEELQAKDAQPEEPKAEEAKPESAVDDILVEDINEAPVPEENAPVPEDKAAENEAPAQEENALAPEDKAADNEAPAPEENAPAPEDKAADNEAPAPEEKEKSAPEPSSDPKEPQADNKQ